MNKFTHTFRQQHLESLYQKGKQDYCYNGFKKVSFLSMIMILMRLIAFGQSNNVVGILVASTSLLIIFVMSILIMRFYQSGTIFCMIFINNLIILVQLQDQSDQTNQFILGTNVAIAHSSILLIVDYKLTLLNIFFQTGLKLFIAALLDANIDASSIILSVFCPLCFVSVVHTIEKQKRLLFLSNHQGNDWHCLLPSIISDPFILFTYDEDRMSFRYKNSNLIDHFPYSSFELQAEENFRQFLRMSTLGKITLEQFILNRIEKQTKFFDLNQFTLKPNEHDSTDFEEKSILLAELYHLEDNFLIVLEQSKHRAQTLQTTKDNLINLIGKHQQLVQNFLKKQGQIINNCILSQNNRMQLIYQLKLHHMYFEGKYKVSNSFQQVSFTSETVCANFRQLFLSTIQLFKKAYKECNFQFDCSETQFDVVHYKDMVQDFILQLVQVTLRKSNNDFKKQTRFLLHSKSELLFIRIICMNTYLLAENLNKNLVIKNFLKFHSPQLEVKVTEGGVFIELYKDVSVLKSFDKFESFS
ncbi:unnamed protein product (macronuclear) [Paramecium tetraurelia]|uniref:Transmembrane protein n=1 Tax=Paramecium tetraurelia TaxID=5888 RepID=A0CFZ8_PARTE|nr:uncharacterized protein GSPATT00038157001 [Paramecium tetraurelia]CAK69715.1 unnamed protein product [Paramecium tetraurelia]|eukprot:XP_001437112.1 hypothetical protein (macronuclear) [Paramecium tetraurelia strain d4-2]